MSNAKWCDSCGNVFPEGADGSETGTGRITSTFNGRSHTSDMVRDYCPDCVAMRSGAYQVRPQLRGGNEVSG